MFCLLIPRHGEANNFTQAELKQEIQPVELHITIMSLDEQVSSTLDAMETSKDENKNAHNFFSNKLRLSRHSRNSSRNSYRQRGA